MRSIRRVSLGIALLILIASPTLAGEWQGREEMRDGVLHVLNPATPMEGHRVIQPRELWRLAGEEEPETDEEMFGMVEQIRVDEDGNVYILDVQLNEIRIFSADGEFLRSIHQEGEGPGDFRNPNDFFFLPDGRIGVVQLMPARIAMMERNGDGLADLPLPQGQDNAMMFMVRSAKASRDLVLLGRTTITFDDAAQNSRAGLVAIDHSGAVLGTWRDHSSRREQSGTVHIKSDRELSWIEVWDLAEDNRCFVAPHHTGYRIEVLDGEGNTERVIEREYEPIRRTKAELAKIGKRYDDVTFGDRKLEFEVNPLRRDIVSVQARPNGEIWVLSSEGEAARAEGTVGRYEVFDAKGRFVRTLSIEAPYDPDYDRVILRGDRLFLLKEVNNGPRTMSSSTAAGSMTMIMQGDDTEEDDEREPEPFEIICYSLEE